MSVSIKIEGLEQLLKTLQQLPKATGKNVLKKALLNAADPMVQAAKAYAPSATGTLRDSIAAGTKLTKRQRRMRRKRDKNDVEVFVGTGPLPYAHLVEFGSIHNEPHPFMRPAFDRTKDDFIDDIGQDIWDELEQALKRTFGKAVKG